MTPFYGYTRTKKAFAAAAVTLTAGAAGFCNGLLGAGGGIIIVFLTHYLLKNENYTEDQKSKDILVNSLSVSLPMSAISAITYGISGRLNGINLAEYIIPAVAGGIAGAWLLDKLDRRIISLFFAALVIYSGISMIAR